MATHFYPLTIKKIVQETADCVSISFTIPDNLSSTFTYKEGQNITLRTQINGEEVRRSYSICNAPHEGELKVAIKKVAGGVFSTYANAQLQQGSNIEVMPPSGKFTIKSEVGNYLGIASGSGITPIIGIIKHVLYTQPHSQFTLLYGNKNRASIIFFEALEALKNTYMERFTCINILSRERTDAAINYGRINEEKLQALQPLLHFKNFNHAYLCGPEDMIFSSAAYLQKVGVANENIHFELFNAVGKKTIKNIQQPETIADIELNDITIKLDGRSFQFKLATKGQNILDAALQRGADLPYACKGGVCCTCRAKLIQGKVHMDVNYALEDEEVAQGFILTCQSHPLTNAVVIDFDEK